MGYYAYSYSAVHNKEQSNSTSIETSTESRTLVTPLTGESATSTVRYVITSTPRTSTKGLGYSASSVASFDSPDSPRLNSYQGHHHPLHPDGQTLPAGYILGT